MVIPNAYTRAMFACENRVVHRGRRSRGSVEMRVRRQVLLRSKTVVHCKLELTKRTNKSKLVAKYGRSNGQLQGKLNDGSKVKEQLLNNDTYPDLNVTIAWGRSSPIVFLEAAVSVKEQEKGVSD